MLEFGKYTLKYEPPSETPEDHSVEMTISSEANLPQMLEFFSSFLRAAGYEFDGKELCLEREAPNFDLDEEWGADPGYFSCYPDGSPYQVHYWGGSPKGSTSGGSDGEASTQNYPIMN